MKHLILLSGLVLLTCSCDPKNPAPAEPADQTPMTEEPPVAETDPAATPLRDLNASAAARMLRNFQAGIDLHTAKAAERDDNWLSLNLLAKTYMARVNLTADWKDFQLAEAAIDKAFQRAPEGSGPFLSRAELNFTLHRLDRIEDDLVRLEMRVLQDDSQKANVAGIRGDMALQRGQLDEARKLFVEALKNNTNTKSLARLANLERHLGHYELADAQLDQALTKAHINGPFIQAWVELQRGILDLDRNKLADALTHFEAANKHFDGWYLVDEHIAEVYALRGEFDKAEALYRDIIARTQSGEFMDALASILRHTNRKDEAQALEKQATEAYERQLKMFPEAAYGHAIHHFLTVDPKRALKLAQLNHTLRPGQEAKTWVAAALLRLGKNEEATKVIREIEQSAWSTAEYHAIAHCAYQRSANQDGAAKHATAAAKISGKALEEFNCE